MRSVKYIKLIKINESASNLLINKKDKKIENKVSIEMNNNDLFSEKPKLSNLC